MADTYDRNRVARQQALEGNSTPVSRGAGGREDRAPSKPKSTTSRVIDAAVSGTAIAALAGDAGRATAVTAQVVTGAARNTQIAKSVGSKAAKAAAAKVAARAAEGAAKPALSAALAKAAQSPIAQAAGKLINSPVMNGLSKVALPILAARAAYNAFTGYQKDGAKGALLGAADVATFGLASIGFNKAKAAYDSAMAPASSTDTLTASLAKANASMFPTSGRTTVSEAPGGSARISTADASKFTRENQRFMPPVGAKPPGEGGDKPTGGPRGFANPAVQRAAQEARGVMNVSEWAKGAKAAPKDQSPKGAAGWMGIRG